jgi:hypothetical protein
VNGAHRRFLNLIKFSEMDDFEFVVQKSFCTMKGMWLYQISVLRESVPSIFDIGLCCYF